MFFGAHVSIRPSLNKAPENAAQIGCEVFQFFTQSPRGGKRQKPSPEIVRKFKANLKKYDIKASYVHAPYFINLASKNHRIFYGSIGAIRHDLEVASMLGAKGVVIHLGSARDFKPKNPKKIPAPARELVVKGLKKILESYRGRAKLILEIAAGAGSIIGSDLEQLSYFLKKVKGVAGICFDTAHAFEAGLKLNTEADTKRAVDQIQKQIGINKLLLIHANDSKTVLGSNSDRHEHLGQGEIGLEPFSALVRDKRLKKVDMIVETPTLKGMEEDIKLLNGLREGK